jgi:hypothetical protein
MTTPRRILFATLGLIGAAARPAAARPDPAVFEAARTKAFAEADADGNGALSSDEFEAFHEAMRRALAAARFAKADANGDGLVTAEELAAARPRRGHCGPPTD